MEEKVSYDFSESSEREDTNAEKYTLRQKLFGTEDVMPAWVADMDLDTPDFVLEAVKKRLNHPVIGYEEIPESAFLAQIQWMHTQHGVLFEKEDMLYSHSVVASMSVAIEALTKMNEKIIVQTPVYPPFFHSVRDANRCVVKNSLKLADDGTYSFDIEDLKAKIDKDTKLLLLCSPHNPVGRVWRRDELMQILEVCLENNIVVFADEIHCDLVYEPNVHIPFASLSDKAKDITITAIGVGKTFNMAGFAISTIAIPNENLRKRFKEVYDKNHFAQGSVLSHVAFEAAYAQGKEWLEDLKAHLKRNFVLLQTLCEKYSQDIKLTNIQGTYLAWLDCRGMQLRDKDLREFFVKDAKLGLSLGVSFGREGSGYMRLNFAVSSAKMLELIQRLDNALGKRKKRDNI